MSSCLKVFHIARKSARSAAWQPWMSPPSRSLRSNSSERASAALSRSAAAFHAAEPRSGAVISISFHSGSLTRLATSASILAVASCARPSDSSTITRA